MSECSLNLQSSVGIKCWCGAPATWYKDQGYYCSQHLPSNALVTGLKCWCGANAVYQRADGIWTCAAHVNYTVNAYGTGYYTDPWSILSRISVLLAEHGYPMTVTEDTETRLRKALEELERLREKEKVGV